jgi:ABC-type phosphate transport system permease subunit
MLYVLGALVAVGAGVAFAVVGVLAIWGGLNTLSTEVPRDYVRTRAGGGARIATSLLVGLPVLITGLFGVLALVRMVQMALGG